MSQKTCDESSWLGATREALGPGRPKIRLETRRNVDRYRRALEANISSSGGIIGMHDRSDDGLESLIFAIRGQRVMFDVDLAKLYGVPTKALVQAVKRNLDRFPADFSFQLNKQELTRLRSQIVTSNGRGGRRTAPYVFTEQGVAMLSSVLSSKRAVHANIAIIRTFVRLRRMLAEHVDLAAKLAELERKYDRQFKIVFDAIRELMQPSAPDSKRPIGFTSWKDQD